MGWTKSDYEGKVCWERGGQRLFDTADIDKLENEMTPSHICVKNGSTAWEIFLFGFLIGLFTAGILQYIT